MAKYEVQYEVRLLKTAIVEASSYSEAKEKFKNDDCIDDYEDDTLDIHIVSVNITED